MDNHGAKDQVPVTVHDSDGDSSRSLSSPEMLFRDFVENGMLSLFRVEDKVYDVIKGKFLSTMAVCGEGTELVAVHKFLYTSGLGKERLEGFESLREEVAAKRGGDANVKLGWYGGSGAEICDVLRYGFVRCGDFEKGVSDGVGVYLSPEYHPIDSVLRAKEDENGIRHMLLCDIILGKTETITVGSEQVYLSSTDFDSGIDNRLMPRTYIIRNAYMNSHILPIILISFKAPSLQPGIGKMNKEGMGMGAGPGDGSGPTLLQRVDTDQVSVTVHDSNGDSRSLSSLELFKEFVVNGKLRLIRAEGNIYDGLKQRFMEVMAVHGEGIEVVAIHNILYTSSGSLKAKFEGFGCLREEVKAKRGGNENFKFGWYGGSGAEICEVLRYGFGRCGHFERGVCHGVGVYLSPEPNPVDSAFRAKEDENGIRHMLLCDIVLGTTETIPAGSEQVYPSSIDFDSGIDNPLTPSAYIIWSAYMNSHILPVFMYSFKAPSLPGTRSGTHVLPQYQQLPQMSAVGQPFRDEGVKPMQAGQPAPDQFGLLGFLSGIKRSGPASTSLALGIDPTTLGLNLNSSENLHKTFGSPWSNEPTKGDPEFIVPQCYNAKQPPPLTQDDCSKLPLHTLVYIFYSMPKDVAQLYAANEMCNRGWFYHKEHNLWFTRVTNTEPLVKTSEYEKGSYMFFDLDTMETVIKDNFLVHYDKVENRPVLPQIGPEMQQPHIRNDTKRSYLSVLVEPAHEPGSTVLEHSFSVDPAHKIPVFRRLVQNKPPVRDHRPDPCPWRIWRLWRGNKTRRYMYL